MRGPEYQSLKGRIHEELLNRLNLERLSQVKREDAEPELRSVTSGLLLHPLDACQRIAIDKLAIHGPLEEVPEAGQLAVDRGIRHL